MKMNPIYMTLLIAVVDSISGCVSVKTNQEPISPWVINSTKESLPNVVAKPKKRFHRQESEQIPVEISSFGVGMLNADIYYPHDESSTKTLVIIVPGSGNVSRHGEVSGDGIKSYKQTLSMSHEWAKVLADRGYYVLTYDKRTCNHKINQLCLNNDQRDIDLEGIKALAVDLDQVYAFALDRLRIDTHHDRVLLMSTTQGAQVLTLSSCAKDAHGILLFSPIIGDLESMWVNGLGRASERARTVYEKNDLLNKKESMSAFFKTLKSGNFAESANIRGATFKFWQSWIESANQTLISLKKNNRPTLLLVSKQDSFISPSLMEELNNETHRSSFVKVKYYTDIDRNFVTEEGCPNRVIKDVIDFIVGLQA